MTITLKIDNPHLEEQLLLFLKEQKQGVEEVTVEALQFFINAFKQNHISKVDSTDLEYKNDFNPRDFFGVANSSKSEIDGYLRESDSEWDDYIDDFKRLNLQVVTVGLKEN